MASTKTTVLTAIAANALVAVCKLGAAVVSGSASMMNEFIHSLMDTANQALLFFGLRESERPADNKYAFGHHQKKYLWNLGSAIGLFSIGAGLGLMHAYHSWHLAEAGPHEETGAVTLFGTAIDPTWVTVIVLAIAFLLEGYSFLVAVREFFHKMRAAGESSAFKFLKESDDPTLVAVVLEDSLAVTGLGLAAIGILLSTVTGNPYWDIGFSAIIAVLLGAVALFLFVVNARYLADMRDSAAEQAFIDIAKRHRQIERYHDLRSIVLDESNTILVAEVELREESMLVGLDKEIDKIAATLKESLPHSKSADAKVQRYIETRAVVEAVLRRTEQVIDEIVTEIKQTVPRVTHCTIEVEGMTSPPDALEEQPEAHTGVQEPVLAEG